MATAAQIEANRKNALRSTGPRTEEGKAASRRNALKHGLASRQLLPEQDEAAAADLAERWRGVFGPRDAWDEHLIERMAADALRARRCQAEEWALRDLAARRAELCWDDERALEAEVLGRSLARRPAEVKLQLERTPQGCAWLAARWGELAYALESGRGWDDAQLALARRLLGIDEARPSGPCPLDRPDGERLELARREAGRLEARRGRLAGIDAAERELAECGMGPEVEKAVRRVRRYESACLRRVEWALAGLRARREAAPADREVPAVAPAPAPARTKPIPPEGEEISPLASLSAAGPRPSEVPPSLAPGSDFLSARPVGVPVAPIGVRIVPGRPHPTVTPTPNGRL